MEILVADDIEIAGGLLHPSYDYYQRVTNSDFFSRHPWSRYIQLFVITQTLLMEIPYYLTSSRYSSKEIIVEPIFLHLVGRARFLKESPIMTMRLRQKKLPEPEMPKLVVDHDGYYYPSYMCFYRDHLGMGSICDAHGCQLVPAATGHAELMRLGRVGGRSLAEAIEMEALLRKHAPENVVNTLSLDRDKCQICLENKLSLFGRCVS